VSATDLLYYEMEATVTDQGAAGTVAGTMSAQPSEMHHHLLP
jgi:hypothetical protein